MSDREGGTAGGLLGPSIQCMMDSHMDLEIISGSSTLPFYKPNVRPGYEYEDIVTVANNSVSKIHENGCLWWSLCSVLTVATGGLVLCDRIKLIDAGQLGLAVDNGTQQVLPPGPLIH